MTTSFNGADAVVRMLQLNGVKHIFGLCGDTSLPFYDALARLDHGMDHILTRDERSAGYMADGYARASGRLTAANVHASPARSACAKGLAEVVLLICCRAWWRPTNPPCRCWASPLMCRWAHVASFR